MRLQKGMMKQWIQTSCFTIALSLFLTGCQPTLSSSPRLKKEDHISPITLYFPDLPQTLHPRKAHTVADQTAILMLMEGLTRIDQAGKSVLNLAKRVDISPDEKTYTFSLHPSKWSNGDHVTSRDFAYAWKKCLSSDFNAPNGEALYAIKNGQEAKMGTLPLSLVGIETPDDDTLIVTLKAPSPSFLTSLSHPIFFPVNRLVEKKNPNWAEAQETYVGNGPFALKKWNREQLNVQKNDGYWDQQAVKLSHIHVVKASVKPSLKTGCIQEGSFQPVQTRGNLQSTLFPKEWIVVNSEKTPLENKHVRQALAYAILPESTFHSLKEEGKITSIDSTFSQPLLKGEIRNDQKAIDRAQPFLNAAFNELDLPSETFPPFSLLYCSDETNDLLAQTLQTQWKDRLGIQIDLEGVEKKEFLKRMSEKQFSLSLGNWTTGFKHPVFNGSLLKINHKELLVSDGLLIPLSYFTLFDSKDKQLKGITLMEEGYMDFKWAYLN